MPLAWILGGLGLVIAAGMLIVVIGGRGFVLALGCFLLLWFLGFFTALLIDEDMNHWDWPTDDGPGRAVNVRLAGLTGLAAALPVAVVWLVLNQR